VLVKDEKPGLKEACEWLQDILADGPPASFASRGRFYKSRTPKKPYALTGQNQTPKKSVVYRNV